MPSYNKCVSRYILLYLAFINEIIQPEEIMEAWYRKIFSCWATLSVSLFVCLFVILSPCLFVTLSFSVFLCLSFSLSLCLFVSLSLFIFLSFSLFLSVSLSVIGGFGGRGWWEGLTSWGRGPKDKKSMLELELVQFLTTRNVWRGVYPQYQ